MANTAPMPGRLGRPWCPYCHAPAGPDCPDRSLSKRQVRRRLAAETAREAQEVRDELTR